MRVQGADSDVDVDPTAFECFECGETQQVDPDFYSGNSDDLVCDEDPGHAVRFILGSDRPLFSPNAVLVGREWANLTDVDEDSWHYRNRQFEYDLEDK